MANRGETSTPSEKIGCAPTCCEDGSKPVKAADVRETVKALDGAVMSTFILATKA